MRETMQPDDPGVQLTADEVAFYKRYYADYTVGRRLACFFVRSLVALGAICGALGAILGLMVAGTAAWRTWQGHP